MPQAADPREVPNLKWREDGIGNIRLYHPDHRAGKNVSDPDEYLELVKAGWVHCPENLPPLEGQVAEEPKEEEKTEEPPTPKKRARRSKNVFVGND